MQCVVLCCAVCHFVSYCIVSCPPRTCTCIHHSALFAVCIWCHYSSVQSTSSSLVDHTHVCCSVVFCAVLSYPILSYPIFPVARGTCRVGVLCFCFCFGLCLGLGVCVSPSKLARSCRSSDACSRFGFHQHIHRILLLLLHHILLAVHVSSICASHVRTVPRGSPPPPPHHHTTWCMDPST